MCLGVLVATRVENPMSRKTLAIVPAGGSGRRMGADVPKQYLSLAGQPILIHTLRALHDSPAIDEIFLVAPPEDRTLVETLLRQEGPFEKITRIIAGGLNRQDSTRNGIMASREEHGILLIHDGVRPFITADLIERVIRAADLEGAAIAAVPVRDTVKKRGQDDSVTTTNREDLWLAQTPQAFRRDIIWKAHEEALNHGFLATDDAALVERLGIAVKLAPGSSDNIKITTPEDLALAELLVKNRSKSYNDDFGDGALRKNGENMRVGSGYDSHRFAVGRRLILGGHDIPSEMGLLGHSDADVLVHAICDAILGAMAEGDLGRHFPDTDPSLKGISSMNILASVGEMAASKGYRIANVDSTVILEQPRLGAHIPAMIENIARILAIPARWINIKAKTNEGMGFIGRGEGIAALATVLLRKNNDLGGRP